MNEPWISQETLGLLLMLMFIPLGALSGTLAWLFVKKGKANKLTRKARKLTMGVIAFGLVMGFIFIVFGIIAYSFGQPRSVWLTSGLDALSCAIFFGGEYWLILYIYRDGKL